MNQQRAIIYKQRREVLQSENIKENFFQFPVFRDIITTVSFHYTLNDRLDHVEHNFLDVL
jgi:preprotein translocase subunit SecA